MSYNNNNNTQTSATTMNGYSTVGATPTATKPRPQNQNLAYLTFEIISQSPLSSTDKANYSQQLKEIENRFENLTPVADSLEALSDWCILSQTFYKQVGTSGTFTDCWGVAAHIDSLESKMGEVDLNKDEKETAKAFEEMEGMFGSLGSERLYEDYGSPTVAEYEQWCGELQFEEYVGSEIEEERQAIDEVL